MYEEIPVNDKMKVWCTQYSISMGACMKTITRRAANGKITVNQIQKIPNAVVIFDPRSDTN